MTGLVYNNTVLGGLLDLCNDNCTLVAMLLVELGELCEGVFAGNVGVEDEEGCLVFAKNGLSELQGAGGAQGLGLHGECDFDVVLLLILQLRVSWALLSTDRSRVY